MQVYLHLSELGQLLVKSEKNKPKKDMSEEHILRYTDLAAAIQFAKANDLTTREIVRELTRGMTYSDALKYAKRAAPLLDITVMEFMRLRKNE